MSNQNQKGGPEQDIMKQLGPLTEINMKIKLPKAFVDYINEKTMTEIGQYCSEEITLSMIAHLDGGEDIVLKNYTIPKAIAYRDNEIMNAYLGKHWGEDL
jgi:hypothetical protein